MRTNYQNSKRINKFKITLIRYRSKVTIPCVFSENELENNRKPISSTKICPILEGSVVMNMCVWMYQENNQQFWGKNHVKFHSEVDSGKWNNLAYSEAYLRCAFQYRLWFVYSTAGFWSTCECVDENLQSPSLLCSTLLHWPSNVIHHLRNKMRRERFCTIKGIQFYGCAYKSEINHSCSASNFSLL